MLTINGSDYAKNNKEFTESLFNPKGTCRGFYRKRKDGVLLMDMQRKPLIFIKQAGTTFAVSCGVCPISGKTHYMFSTTATDSELLGLDAVSYSKHSEYLSSAIGHVMASFKPLTMPEQLDWPGIK